MRNPEAPQLTAGVGHIRKRECREEMFRTNRNELLERGSEFSTARAGGAPQRSRWDRDHVRHKEERKEEGVRLGIRTRNEMMGLRELMEVCVFAYEDKFLRAAC